MRDLLTEICSEAGRLLLDEYRRAGLARREKRDAGWVTAADEQSEALILEALERATPDAGVVAEESGARQGSGELTWYVDPLDGTTNFTRGLDYFSVSIAGAVGGELPLTPHPSPLRGTGPGAGGGRPAARGGGVAGRGPRQGLRRVKGPGCR